MKQIYFIQMYLNSPIKIGYTNNFNQRKKQIQTYSPNNIHIIRLIEGNTKVENMIHNKLKNYVLEGEWFQPSQEVLDFIDQIPNQNIKKQKEFINNYIFKPIVIEIPDKNKDIYLKYKVKLINDKLDLLIKNSKNSGFLEGVKSSKGVFNCYFNNVEFEIKEGEEN